MHEGYDFGFAYFIEYSYAHMLYATFDFSLSAPCGKLSW